MDLHSWSNKYKFKTFICLIIFILSERLRQITSIRMKLDDETSMIYGQKINFTDLISKFNGTWRDSCKKFKYLELIGINEIIIDTDFKKTDCFNDLEQISIITIQLRIITRSSFNLSGIPARNHTTKAASGLNVSENGEAGEPGLPGGSGANFLVVAQNIDQLHLLTVLTYGSRGGTGQDGGDGVDGKPEVTCSKPKNGWSIPSVWSESLHDYEEECIKEGFIKFVETCKYICFGRSDSSKGGDGGASGRGGFGGNPGEVVLISLTGAAFNVNVISGKGENGLDGKPGKGGAPAELVNDLNVVTIRDYSLTNILNVPYIRISQVNYNKSIRVENTYGQNGSIEDSIDPLMLDERKLFRPYHAINEYKFAFFSHVLEFEIDDEDVQAHEEFLKLLMINTRINEFYDIGGLLRELEGMNAWYFRIIKKFSLLPYYKLFLARLRNNTEEEQTFRNNGNENEMKKLFSMLYAAALSKLCITVDHEANELMYFNVTIEINKIKDRVGKIRYQSIEEVMKELKNKHDDTVGEKISRLETFINSDVTPLLRKSSEETATEMISSLSNSDELAADKKLRIQFLWKSRQSFGAQNIFYQILTNFVKIGRLMNYVMSESSVIFKPLIIGAASENESIRKLQNQIEELVNQIRNEIKQKCQCFSEQVTDVLQELDKYPNKEALTFKNIVSYLNEVKTEILLIIQNETNLIDSKSLHYLNNSKEISLNLMEMLINEQKSPEMANISTYALHILLVSDPEPEYYNKIRNNQMIINHLGEEIRNLRSERSKIVELEMNIYDLVLSVALNMSSVVNRYEKFLGTKNQISLNVKEWQVELFLQNMIRISSIIKKETKLLCCTSYFQIGFELLQDLFEYVGGKECRLEFFAYLHNIFSEEGKKIEIENSHNEVFNSILYSNFMLAELSVAHKIFQLYVIPWADWYQKFKYGLYSLSIPADIEDLKYFESATQDALDKLREVLVYEGRTAMSIKRRYKPFVFSNRMTPTFYNWAGNDSNAIRDLFQGKEIVLYMNVTRKKFYTCMQFHEVKIKLRNLNKNISEKLEKDLMGFHVSMTHPGFSYYWIDAVYVIRHPSLQLIHSFEEDENNKPIYINDIYKSLAQNSDAIVSPYTVWKVKLLNVKGNFSSLAKYVNEDFKIELVGLGAYYIPQGEFKEFKNFHYYSRTDAFT